MRHGVLAWLRLIIAVTFFGVFWSFGAIALMADIGAFIGALK